jgi:hypothetical protein
VPYPVISVLGRCAIALATEGTVQDGKADAKDAAWGLVLVASVVIGLALVLIANFAHSWL